MLKPPEDVIYERRAKWDDASPLLMRTNQSRAVGILNRQRNCQLQNYQKRTSLEPIMALELPSWTWDYDGLTGEGELANVCVLTSSW